MGWAAWPALCGVCDESEQLAGRPVRTPRPAARWANSGRADYRENIGLSRGFPRSSPLACPGFRWSSLAMGTFSGTLPSPTALRHGRPSFSLTRATSAVDTPPRFGACSVQRGRVGVVPGGVAGQPRQIGAAPPQKKQIPITSFRYNPPRIPPSAASVRRASVSP